MSDRPRQRTPGPVPIPAAHRWEVVPSQGAYILMDHAALAAYPFAHREAAFEAQTLESSRYLPSSREVPLTCKRLYKRYAPRARYAQLRRNPRRVH